MNASTNAAKARSDHRTGRAIPHRVVLPHVLPQRRQAAASALARTLRLDESRMLEEMLGNAFYMRRGLSEGSAAAVVDALQAMQIPAYAEPDFKTRLGRPAASSVTAPVAASAPTVSLALDRVVAVNPEQAPRATSHQTAPLNRDDARSRPVPRRSGVRNACVTAVLAMIAAMLLADALLPLTKLSAEERVWAVLLSATATLLYVLPSLIAMCFRVCGWRAALPINFFVGVTGWGWALLLRHVVIAIRRNDVEQWRSGF